MIDGEPSLDSSRLGPLEEVCLPLEEPDTPEPLAPDVLLFSPDGQIFRVTELIQSNGRQRLYHGMSESDSKGVWIREAWEPESVDCLAQEARILKTVEVPMIPAQLAWWEDADKAFLVTESRSGPILEDVWLKGGWTLTRTLSLLDQVAYAISRLHNAGWVHLGLRPKVIIPSKPASIVNFADAVRVGEKPKRSFYYSGYSAPEVLGGERVDPRSDIYSIGALLFHGVVGIPIGDLGFSLTTWVPPTPIAGVPQILHRCLGSLASRYATMEQLHEEILALLRRCASQVTYSTASASTIGLEPTRGTNEDAAGYVISCSHSDQMQYPWGVLCLADGMGGMEAGEVASQTAVQAILRQALEYLPKAHAESGHERASEIKRWIFRANDDVCSAMEQHKARGGTTLVCAALVGRELTIAHVGDSRLYLIRRGAINALTRDHSVAMGLALQGEISYEEVRFHADRNKVTRSLGDRRPLPDYFVDTLEVCTGRESLQAEPGDILLLCSDGVWEPLTEEEIMGTATGGIGLNQIAQNLLKKVLECGAPDNATVVLLRVEETNVLAAEESTI